MDIDFEDPNDDYTPRLKALFGIMNEYGSRSDQARDYLNKAIDEVAETEVVQGEFEKRALTVVALKWQFPNARTFEELMELARRKYGESPFENPEVRGLEDYFSGMFGGDFKPDEE